METPEEQLAKQHRKEKKDMQGKLTKTDKSLNVTLKTVFTPSAPCNSN